MQEEATRKYYEQLINECGSVASSNMQQLSYRLAEPAIAKKRLSTQSGVSNSQVKLKVPASRKKKSSKSKSRSPSGKQTSRPSLKRKPVESQYSVKKRSTQSSLTNTLRQPYSLSSRPSAGVKFK